jgi:hypothetical protein
MHKTGIILFAIAVFVGPSICLTGSASSDAGKSIVADDLKPVCENFIRQISHGDKDAFNLIWKNMVTPPEASAGRETEAQRQAEELRFAEGRYGKYLGCELVQEKNSGNSLRKYVYLAKYEKNVLQWTVILYRPHGEWKILSFLWTAPGDSLF